MSFTRRDLNLLLPALAASAAIAQDKKLLPSACFKYEDLPVKVNGENRQRAVLNGTTHKGSGVEIHMTELGPGLAPHPPHKHLHEEMVLLRTGELDVTISGKTTRLTAWFDGLRGLERRARLEESDQWTGGILRNRARTEPGLDPGQIRRNSLRRYIQ